MNRPTAARSARAVARALLLALARPPLDLGSLACVAFVPLFVAWRERPRGAAATRSSPPPSYYAILMSWSWYFGTIAIVPLVIALGAYWARAGAVLGWLRAGGFRTRSSSPRCGCWPRRPSPGCRSAGSRGVRSGYAFHDIGGRAPWRATAASRSSRSSRSRSTRCSPTRWSTCATGAGARAPACGRRSRRSWCRARVTVVARRSRHPRRTDPGRDPPGQRQEPRPHATPRSTSATSRTATSSSPHACSDPVDLIVFPESSMDADPRTDPYLRRRSPRRAKHHAWVLANAVADARPTARRR